MNSTIAFSSQHQASQFASAAGITLWAYDYLVTFSEEIDLLWGGSVIWWLKVLFLSNRLIPILETFSVGQSEYFQRLIWILLTSLAALAAWFALVFLPLLIHMDSTKEFVGTFE
ncbi:hypothetical protein FRC19_005855 [Serendipita sp. 401]|nr:hypothetical protein FRC19_005855 [Serendipita sp. 401]